MQRESENEQRALLEALHRALVEIRFLASQGRAQQAAELADAVHNVPVHLHAFASERGTVIGALRQYQQAYPRPQGDYFDYLAILGVSSVT